MARKLPETPGSTFFRWIFLATDHLRQVHPHQGFPFPDHGVEEGFTLSVLLSKLGSTIGHRREPDPEFIPEPFRDGDRPFMGLLAILPALHDHEEIEIAFRTVFAPSDAPE